MEITRFENIEKHTSSTKTNSFFSILKDSGCVELSYAQTQKGAMRKINDNDKVIEKHYFILSGCFQIVGTNEIIKANDLLSFDTDSDEVILTALENTVFIIIMVKKDKTYSIHNTSKQSYDLLKKIHTKDEYTLTHSTRVNKISQALCQYLNYPESEIFIISKAGMFHDLGKIDVPDEILKSPNKLTVEEYDIIKKHPMDALMHLKDYHDELVHLIISQHHERLDGSGYPLGLKGSEIHEYSQIISVVDAFDAMTTKRTYKDAHSYEWAIEKLKSQSNQYCLKFITALEELLAAGFDPSKL